MGLKWPYSFQKIRGHGSENGQPENRYHLWINENVFWSEQGLESRVSLGGREGGKVEGRVVQWHTTTWLPFESSRLKMLSRPRQVLNSYSPSTAVKTATFCVKSHSCGFYSRLDSLIDRVTESSHWTIRSKSRTLGLTSSHKRLNQSVWDSVFERSVGWLLNKRMTIAGMYSSYAVTKRKPSNPVQVRLFFFFFFSDLLFATA